MRITTQMLNESARQAGLPINRSTLLDYIKNDGATNPLLEAMNRNKENVANTAKRAIMRNLIKRLTSLHSPLRFFCRMEKTVCLSRLKRVGTIRRYMTALKIFLKTIIVP